MHVLRDPTRGGVTSAVTEIAQSAGVGIVLNESSIPINEEVKGACEILGLDPLYVANEGKLIAIVAPGEADTALTTIRRHPLGKGAAIIGEVTTDHPGFVVMTTAGRDTRSWTCCRASSCLASVRGSCRAPFMSPNGRNLLASSKEGRATVVYGIRL